MDNPVAVYSVKVDSAELAEARKFFARSGLQLHDVVRSIVRMAAGCQTCLKLVEGKAPVSQIQSSFASILADAKETWRLNGLFQEVMLKTAETCNLPKDFITNVLAEAQRIYDDMTKPLPERQDRDDGDV